MAMGVGEEPDEVEGFVLGGDEFLEGVVEEVVAEGQQFVGLGDRVDLHVAPMYDADEVVGEVGAVGREGGLRLDGGLGREGRPWGRRGGEYVSSGSSHSQRSLIN